MRDQFLSELFERHYLPLRLRGKSKESARLHRHAIRTLAKFLGRQPTTADFTDETISRLMHWGRQRGLAAPSVNRWRNTLLAQWRFAARKGYVSQWPDVEPDNEPEIVPLAWMEDERARLFAACRAQQGWIDGVRADLWWTALNLVIYDTAERVGAVLQLPWQAVDLENGWVTFAAETRKGGRKARMFRIHPETVEILKLILVPVRELVFPWQRSLSLLWTRYGRLLKSAGLPHGRRDKFHRMRRTTASLYKAAGGDPQELLGHSSRRTTDRYLDPRICQAPQAIDRLPRPWS